MKSLSYFTISAVALLAACAQPTKTAAPAGPELAPAVHTPAQTGDIYENLNLVTGETTSATMTVLGDGKVRGVSSNGCTWVYIDGAFAPTLEWANCDGSDGRHQVSGEATIFPLEVGKQEVWTGAGQNAEGETWVNNRTCTVEGTASVTVPAGEFDTYYIVCVNDWEKREIYYAPSISVPVITTVTHNERGLQNDWRLVSHTPAAG